MAHGEGRAIDMRGAIKQLMTYRVEGSHQRVSKRWRHERRQHRHDDQCDQARAQKDTVPNKWLGLIHAWSGRKGPGECSRLSRFTVF